MSFRGGGYPSDWSQVPSQGVPWSQIPDGGGVPQPQMGGTPSQGNPVWPGQDVVPPWPGMGYTPWDRTADGVLHTQQSECLLRFPAGGLFCTQIVFIGGNVLFWNKVANVLATCLSNQMSSSRRITTWHYDVVFVYKDSHYFIKSTALSLEF